jgi:hypothetical protein
MAAKERKGRKKEAAARGWLAVETIPVDQISPFQIAGPAPNLFAFFAFFCGHSFSLS